MKKLMSILLPVFSLFASSCAYNNKFLSPRKYTDSTRAVTFQRSGTDSSVVHYHGAPYQPLFLKNGRDTIVLNYTIESVLFKNRTGRQLNGWMLKPATGCTANATILHLHGNGGSLLGQFSAIRPLLEKGFQIFVFDYSGYGFSEGQATRKNLLSDGVDAVDYVKNREDVKNTKLVLYGQSYGGHLAACVAAKSEAAIDALVIEGGFSNHKDLAANGANKVIGFMSRIFVKEIYSGTRMIGGFHKRVLVIHSTEDKVIPFAMGQQLFNKANAPKQFFEIKGAHLAGPALYTEEIAGKIKAMVN